jgi:hypothetical protein
VHLHDALDAVGTVRVPPQRVGEAPGVKVRVDRDVVAEPFGCREDRIQLDLLHRLVERVPRASRRDGAQDLGTVEVA